jgi:hypothetical protein
MRMTNEAGPVVSELSTRSLAYRGRSGCFRAFGPFARLSGAGPVVSDLSDRLLAYRGPVRSSYDSTFPTSDPFFKKRNKNYGQGS